MEAIRRGSAEFRSEDAKVEANAIDETMPC